MIACSQPGCPAEIYKEQLTMNWDWFTGYLPETLYWCPKHRRTPERKRAFIYSREKPNPSPPINHEDQD